MGRRRKLMEIGGIFCIKIQRTTPWARVLWVLKRRSESSFFLIHVDDKQDCLVRPNLTWQTETCRGKRGVRQRDFVLSDKLSGRLHYFSNVRKKTKFMRGSSFLVTDIHEEKEGKKSFFIPCQQLFEERLSVRLSISLFPSSSSSILEWLSNLERRKVSIFLSTFHVQGVENVFHLLLIFPSPPSPSVPRNLSINVQHFEAFFFRTGCTKVNECMENWSASWQMSLKLVHPTPSNLSSKWMGNKMETCPLWKWRAASLLNKEWIWIFPSHFAIVFLIQEEVGH